MINIVLCGGAGKRLWPMSSGDSPKQFVKFGTEDSLYIKTVKRNKPFCDKTAVFTDQKYSDKADRQLTEQRLEADIVMEPSGKGTAVSIMLACLMYPNELFLVTPSDHEISDEEAYADAVKRAKELAAGENIVVFGIEPEQPEDRYGYIQTDGESVVKFHEKPDSETAESYAKDGFLINSGMLCFNSNVMLHEFAQHMPDQIIMARTVYSNIRSGRATHRLCGRFMGEMQHNDIDKSVLEKTDKLKCVKGIKGWRDVGTYESIYDFRNRKEGGNVSMNLGDSYGCADFVDSKGCMILNNDKDVVIAGLEDVVVVETGGKILVAKKGTDIMAAMKKLDG